MAKNSQVGLYAILGVIVGILIFSFMGDGALNIAGNDNAEDITTACALDTTLTTSYVDKYNKGTAVASVTTKYSQDGGLSYSSFTSGTTKLQPGKAVKLFVSKSDYIDQVVDVPALACGVNQETITMAATDAITVEVRDKNGDLLTDSVTGGAANISAVNTGASVSMSLELLANNNEDSGNLVIVVEASSTGNVSEMQLTGATKVDTPSFYAQAATGTAVQAFELSSLNDNAEFKNTLKIVPKDAKDIRGGVYITVYSAQAFEETDGSVIEGIENGEGTVKYEDTYDYDVFIEN